ncbi:TPA: DNA methyltransferase [Pseudomonas aeruginosa]|uniref:site-specific DNA-methyltransferase n=1 Tax=Pseudomonas aeruginosa TaxID=287 RepID=UPI000CF08158|nr:DNA methyltransferase [Pseudomonas aeruginosa]MBA4929701.1 site-specific DNA-methyltransferase [Pseudomonas aeruginosa]MCO3807699.1 site-specific DNA-methyltransferase [Pseudomonas aeruginosa]PPX78556.1 site-specific DNA-methyltransferase [Pseudomonas aeruginosa]RQB38006.1 site-specific DNA-methyltransferase [Pseudomonas aeruginosa]HCU0648372.1 site-specific DNA-methyltransferase [Pseudomonas aeruginosa]
MSRLTDLIAKAKAKDSALGAELDREFKILSSRLPFGLNFERHSPEAVELPLRPIRKGDKVRVLPERGTTQKGDQRLWQVKAINKVKKTADLELLGAAEIETQTVALDDLVVVAEFRDTIYPGLISTGKVQRGGDKPCHTVINGENYHVLKALTYTHRGNVDAIYIDPPYNTGAKDWKYNNDYVAGDDLYRHSKWLAMMERRLLVAKELLNPVDSVLIATIDEKEYLRLGLLLEQVFPEARIQMISSVINPKGAARSSAFGRTDEYVFFVMFGSAAPAPIPLSTEWKIVRDKRAEGLRWADLLRSGSHPLRSDSPNQFYPIFIENSDDGPRFHSVGEAYFGSNRDEIIAPEGTVAVWPIRANGSEGNWSNSAINVRIFIEKGYARLGRWRGADTSVTYLARGEQKKVESGVFPVIGRKQDNSIVVDSSEYIPVFIPGTQWRIASHNAEQGGTNLQKSMMPDRKFPFPKSLYAVEDALRFFVTNKPEAVVLDFFSGSGTTAHAVMRLNRQDGGRRQCISVTNNEVAADEQKKLREDGLRPGDAKWEKWGICDYITKPRVAAAITGKTPDGEPIKGDYKFTDEFPMADGFEENAEFFTLTYETPVSVNYNLAFNRIAPLLWLRAGARGNRIDKLPGDGWAVADAYGLLSNVDAATPFIKALAKAAEIRIAYIVTDDDRRFQAIAKRLPDGVEPVRLYESYLTNFSFTNGE